MKNNVTGVAESLCEQMERLSKAKGECLAEEISRSDALAQMAEQYISVGSLMLKAKIAIDNSYTGNMTLPKIMED